MMKTSFQDMLLDLRHWGELDDADLALLLSLADSDGNAYDVLRRAFAALADNARRKPVHH
jgi:hypothetical protein